MSRLLPPRLATFATIAGVALAYFAAARLGLSMAFLAEQVTVVWPPSGIALAALVFFGRRAAGGVWLGALAANLTIGEPLTTAVGIASGNTVGGLVGLALLRHAGFSRSLERIWDVMALLGLAGAVASAVSALLGVASLCLTGLHAWSAAPSLAWLWWLGDLMGVTLTAPLLMTMPARRRWPRAQTAEAVLAVVLLLLVTLVVFAGRLPALPGSHQLAYAVFPLVIWVAVRFSPRETAAAILVIAAVAVWGTVSGYGPFTGRSVHESLVLVQVFMAVVAATGLVLAAAIAERRTAERRRAADYAVAHVLAESATLEAAAPRILRAVGVALQWDLGALWTTGEDGVLHCREVWIDPAASLPRFAQATRAGTFARGVGVPGRVWSTGEPCWIPDVMWDGNFPRAPLAAAEGLHTAFAFPIRLGDEVPGVLEFFSHEVRPPDADLLRTFASVGAQIGQFLDRRRTEEERTHLLAELRRAGAAKDEFMAVLGHELRNPLAPLRNALEVLRARGFPDEASRRMGEVMDRQLRYVVRLVDDLLDVSRITRGRIELRKERVDLAEVVRRAVEAAQPLLAQRRHELSVATPPAPPLIVDADPTRLEQVVGNLLHNAARYTDEGGRIAVRLSRRGGEAVLCVEDTGIGLRAEMLERIFEPFVQGQRLSRQPAEGLGIGLSLVRSLLEMHQGAVEAHSAGPGQGSTFTVRLPLAPEERSAPSPSPVDPPVPGPAIPRRRVLIVDDNVDGAESLALVLRQSGHVVTTVHDGRTALAEASPGRFDVVLLDIGLPDGFDGYRVAAELRTRGSAAELVLIALTGFGQEEDRRRTQAAGFAHHLVKPVDPRELDRLLDGL